MWELKSMSPQPAISFFSYTIDLQLARAGTLASYCALIPGANVSFEGREALRDPGFAAYECHTRVSQTICTRMDAVTVRPTGEADIARGRVPG